MAKIIILVFLLIFSNILITSGFNINLIFSLQQNFHSNVIFLENQPENGQSLLMLLFSEHISCFVIFIGILIKRLLKHQESQPKAFIALFDLDEAYFNPLIAEPASSRYENQLVIFDSKSNLIERLIEVSLIKS